MQTTAPSTWAPRLFDSAVCCPTSHVRFVLFSFFPAVSSALFAKEARERRGPAAYHITWGKTDDSPQQANSQNYVFPPTCPLSGQRKVLKSQSVVHYFFSKYPPTNRSACQLLSSAYRYFGVREYAFFYFFISPSLSPLPHLLFFRH